MTDPLDAGTGTSTTCPSHPATAADAGHHTTAYVYNAFGDLLTVTDPKGNVITNTFDLRGNKTASHDPDMGSWSYGYDVLGGADQPDRRQEPGDGADL